MSETVFPTAGRALSVRMLEEELNAVWKESVARVPGARPGSDTGPITRAALMTLVAVVDGKVAADRMTAMIAELTRQTPCRALIVELDGGGERATDHPGTAAEPLSAFASAHCHATSRGRPVCSEQITLRSTPDGDPHLSNLVLPLLLPDLPVVLHWPGVASMMAPAGPPPHPLPRGAQFLCDLDPYVGQVILDSTLAGNPEAYLANVLALAERPAGPGMRPIDLNWVRLLPWRDALADAVDRCAIDVATIREARIESHPDDAGVMPVRPRLLAGWLRDRLRGTTGGAFRAWIDSAGPRGESAPGRIIRLILAMADGRELSIHVEQGTLAVSHGRDSFRFSRPAEDDHLLC
ncbi:MAG TPA: glucose-6-phosphate dehydrogenase assembly protein OpcA, partial [Candidatus Eisenbacteria bacterium]